MDNKQYDLFLGLLIMIATIPYKAYIMIVMWGWFVTPTFDVIAPTLWVMCGLMLMVALATASRTDSKKEDYTSRAITWITTLTFAWGMGWVFHALA